MRDIYREQSGRTLARFRTVHRGLLGFVSAKVIFAMAMVLGGALILLGGGGLAFQFEWRQPGALSGLVVAYAVFAAGLMALIAAVAGNEWRAAMFNNLIVTAIAIGGGCMFPLDNVVFWREHIAPWVPTHWFAGTARDLQGSGGVVWVDDALKLALVGAGCVVLAAWLFGRRLEKGARA
jgi:ABC-2 type transporter